MQLLLIQQILKPVITRIGTILGSSLAGAGVAVGDTESIVLGFTALAGVAIDLITRRWIT